MDENEYHPRVEDETPSAGILLGHMPQQKETRTPEDDWTGVTNAAERRRLQNRLNQRIYRRRRRNPSLAGPNLHEGVSLTKYPISQISGSGANICAATTIPRMSHGTNHKTVSSLELPRTASVQTMEAFCPHSLTPEELEETMNQYERSARRDYELGSPKVDQLLTLMQFNVFRALLTNSSILGFTMEWLQDEAISPWNAGFLPVNRFYPPSLLPTAIQRVVPHHPWIDLWPIPKMRDNILHAGDKYDEDQLCKDLIDFCNIPDAQTGLIVWREPWDPYGWEASDAFISKWGWILKGCTELLESTNYWRAKRGEKTLHLKL